MENSDNSNKSSQASSSQPSTSTERSQHESAHHPRVEELRNSRDDVATYPKPPSKTEYCTHTFSACPCVVKAHKEQREQERQWVETMAQAPDQQTESHSGDWSGGDSSTAGRTAFDDQHFNDQFYTFSGDPMRVDPDFAATAFGNSYFADAFGDGNNPYYDPDQRD